MVRVIGDGFCGGCGEGSGMVRVLCWMSEWVMGMVGWGGA